MSATEVTIPSSGARYVLPQPPPPNPWIDWTRCIIEEIRDDMDTDEEASQFQICYEVESMENDPHFIHPTEARKQAKQNAKSILANYDLLKGILERHEGTIRRRWYKKTRSHRLAILLKAWPDMPVPHRPDYDSCYLSQKEKKKPDLEKKSHFLCPYINQEDLLQSKSLPLLLNSRGRNAPSVFSGSDGVTISDALGTGNLQVFVLPCHSVLLDDSCSARKYGQIQTRHCHRSPEDILPSRIHYTPSEGLYILEAQEKVMKFLTDCCKSILHDIPVDDLTSDKFPILPEPLMELDSDSLGLKSLDAMVMQSQYGVPAQIDLERTENILAARVAAAEDHIWALREDPSYFEEELSESQTHSKELIKDKHGNMDPVIVARHTPILWSRIVEVVLRDSYTRLEAFSDLLGKVRVLRSLHDKYAGKISQYDDFPPDYLHALLTFRFHVEEAASCFCALFRVVATSSPPIRPFYIRSSNLKPRDLVTPVVLLDKKLVNPIERRVVETMHVMLEDNYSKTWNSLPFIIDVIDHIIQQEPQAKSMFTSHTLKALSDVAIVAQCMRQIALYQPWARDFQHDYFRRRRELAERYNRNTEWRISTMRALASDRIRRAGELAMLTPGKFTYPIHRRHGQENVRILRRSEANLDKVWAEVDSNLKEEGLHEHGTPIQCLLWNQRELRRTPEWVGAKATKKVKPTQSTDTNTPIVSFNDSFDASNSDDKSKSSWPKIKVKTRGKPSKKKSNSEKALKDESMQQDDEKDVIAVDRRTLKVFRTILCDSDMTQRPGEVEWVDFLHAMVSVGFKAEKLFGSIWQFSPMKMDVGRSIHFHEPHPQGKMPIQLARRYGGRLNRAYGWTGRMFTLKEKPEN